MVPHCLIFDIINQWICGITGHKHPFIIKWRCWIYKGLNHHKNFRAIKNVMAITTLDEYLQIINECPDVQNRLKWFRTTSWFRYWLLPIVYNYEPHDTPFESDQSNLDRLKQDIHNFQAQYRITLAELQNSVTDATGRMDKLNESINNHEKILCSVPQAWLQGNGNDKELCVSPS